MELRSRLFRGDKKLQACSVNDAAHVTLGAMGEHVAKIHLALFALDALKIDRAELVSQTYGRTTQAAVLSYKTKRRIINPAYQTKPDGIVGKMTVASLDAEMCKKESASIAIGDCLQSSSRGTLSSAGKGVPPSAALRGVQTPGSQKAKGIGEEKPKPLNRALRIFLAITRKAALESAYPSLSASLERAKDSLFEHGLTLSVEFKNGFADTINYGGTDGKIILEDDIVGLRKASEDLRPGLPGILRIIVCPMNSTVFGETFRDRRIANLTFPPFVLMNAQLIDRSNATLLHEMIHAANNGPFKHDKDPSSIFSENGTTLMGNIERTKLRNEHAAKLAQSFFAV